MSTRIYLRDGRAPVPRDARTSETMSRIRARNTGPERRLRALLRAEGIGGYRLHYAKVPGRPDVAFVKHRVAVFMHGCFWHGCPHCRSGLPRTHRTFWQQKIERNRRRDQRKATALRRAGWSVITVRECRLKKAPAAQIRKITRAIAARR